MSLNPARSNSFQGSQPLKEKIVVRLAQNEAEIEAAQKLRYQVFYEEFGAKPSDEVATQKKDFDEFDAVADHVIVIDETLGSGKNGIIGTYRLLRQEAADKVGRFYTGDEYDISPLRECGANILELGRSCVLEEYRTRSVMQRLWAAIADYVIEYDIDIMFGCGSFHGTDPSKFARELSYLYHYHLAPPGLRPVAKSDHHVQMNVTSKESLVAKDILMSLPPLIKGYLRLGAHVGDGAYIDEEFNTTDVCIVLQTHLITDRYKRHYDMSRRGTFDPPSWTVDE